MWVMTWPHLGGIWDIGGLTHDLLHLPEGSSTDNVSIMHLHRRMVVPDGWAAKRRRRETFVEQIAAMVDFLGEDAVAIGTDLPAIAGSSGEEGLSEVEVARRGAAVQFKMNESLAHFPAIFEKYTTNFGNNLTTRYCQGFDTLARWSALEGYLKEAGLSASAIEKTLGLNWIRVCK